MSDSWNNIRAVCCKPWLVLPTVYSDALSYGEQLDKFCYSLNKMIENNNILPDYVANQIKEYISSGAIGEVVREILANYILNVKYPPKGITPAVGDGSADDTEALQGCIDYASENGGVVYFPYGSYLTQSLTMKSGVSLFGFDRYSTKVVLKGGATKALLNGNASELSVCGITLDGNSGIQVNNVNVVDMTGSDLMFNELIIKDGYKLFDFVGDGHLQLNDIVFGNAVENCFSVDGNVIVQAKNLLFMALSKVGGVSVVDVKANGGNYDFNSVAKCDTCMMISGNDNKVVALIGGASKDYVDTGEHNNVEIVGHSQKEYYSGNVKKDANNSETTLQGTRSLHVVGESTVAIDGNSTESIDGTKNEIVTGTSSVQYNDDRIVNGKNINETFSGKKVTNAKDIVLNSTNPLTYKTPEKINEQFSSVPAKDTNGNEYKILVAGEKLSGNPQFINVIDYGAKGDGTTDDYKAFNDALTVAKNYGGKLFIPNGSYSLSSYIITDEKYIGENLGNYPNKKLIYSFSLKESSFASDFYISVPLSLITNGMNNGGQQSAVYIPNRDVIVLGFASKGSDDSLLVEMSTDFSTVKRRVRAHLGHCNDLSYNPDTNKIYASIYDLGNGIIGVVNPVSLAVEGTINITGINSGITMVRYDKNNKVYYMMADALYITDSEFNVLKKVTVDKGVGSLFIPNEYSATQGSEIVNGMFMSLSWISNAQYCESGRLLTINYETNEVKEYYDYPVFHEFDEPESLLVINDDLLIIGYEPDNLLIRKIHTKETGSIVAPVDTYRFNSTTYTLYVDESKTVNGNGLSKDTPINDLAYALKLSKFNQYITIKLLSSTVKTEAINFAHYNGFIRIVGNTGNEVISRKLDLYNVKMIRFDQIKLNPTSGSFIKLKYSEAYFSDSVTFNGNSGTTGNANAVDATTISKVCFENSVFNNCDVCVKVGNGAYAMLYNCSGKGNNILANNNCGLIMLTTIKPTATTVSKKNQYGGLTVLNAQEIPTDYPTVTNV